MFKKNVFNIGITMILLFLIFMLSGLALILDNNNRINKKYRE